MFDKEKQETSFQHTRFWKRDMLPQVKSYLYKSFMVVIMNTGVIIVYTSASWKPIRSPWRVETILPNASLLFVECDYFPRLFFVLWLLSILFFIIRTLIPLNNILWYLIIIFCGIRIVHVLILVAELCLLWCVFFFVFFCLLLYIRFNIYFLSL